MTDPTALPREWEVLPQAGGGVELRIRQDGRHGLIVVTSGLAATWLGVVAGDTARGHALPLGMAPALAWAFAAALVGFAAWCAFARESWHVDRDRLEHRVGLGAWSRTRVFAPGELVIQSSTDNHGWPYHRLFLIDAAGRRQWVLDRNREQLVAIASFLHAHTGWPVGEEGPFGL